MDELAVGVDMYNQDFTGEISATIGTNCGLATGRNGVLICKLLKMMETVQMDDRVSYGLVSKGNGEAFLIKERCMSLVCGGGQAGQGYPAVIIKKNSEVMGFDVYNMADTGSVSKTLNAIRSDSDHTPVVCVKKADQPHPVPIDSS